MSRKRTVKIIHATTHHETSAVYVEERPSRPVRPISTHHTLHLRDLVSVHVPGTPSKRGLLYGLHTILSKDPKHKPN